MSTSDDEGKNLSSCAACGKGDNDGLKTCTACKLVKYCNATCQRDHWPKHKKECKKRAAELHDEALFKQPPSRGECPICCLPLTGDPTRHQYQACCGKILCLGCIHADATENNRNICPFCRTPVHTSDGEWMERNMKRVEVGDAIAIYDLGVHYYRGNKGLRQNYQKAVELWLRAGELGCATANHNLGNCYHNGVGVERDMKKAIYYYELAAIGGDPAARFNLGLLEENEGNMNRAVKHFMIAAGAGCDDSLRHVQLGYMNGHTTKNDFERALRTHKEAKDEMKSEQREAAAAAFFG